MKQTLYKTGFHLLLIFLVLSSSLAFSQVGKNLKVSVKYLQDVEGYYAQFEVENTGDVAVKGLLIKGEFDVNSYEKPISRDGAASGGNGIQFYLDGRILWSLEEYTILPGEKMNKMASFEPKAGGTDFNIIVEIYQDGELIQDTEMCDNISADGYRYFNPMLHSDTVKAFVGRDLLIDVLKNDVLDAYNTCATDTLEEDVSIGLRPNILLNKYKEYIASPLADFTVDDGLVLMTPKSPSSGVLKYSLVKEFEEGDKKIAEQIKEIAYSIYPRLAITGGNEVEISRCESHAEFSLNQNLEGLIYHWQVKEGSVGTVLEGERSHKAKLAIGQYKLEVTDWNNDAYMFEVSVRQKNTLAYTVSDTLEISKYVSNTKPIDLEISSEDFSSLSWMPNEDLDLTDNMKPIPDAQDSKYYTFTVVDSEGCAFQDSIFVKVVDQDIVFSMPEEYIFGSCDDLSGRSIPSVVTGSGDLTYDWKKVGEASRNSERSISVEVGEYELTVTDQFGYSKSHTLHIKRDKAPKLNFGEDLLIRPNDLDTKIHFDLEYDVVELKDSQWNTTEGLILPDENIENTEILPDDFGKFEYILSLTDKYNCVVKDTVLVEFLDYKEPELTKDTVNVDANRPIEIQVLENDSPAEGGWDLSTFEILEEPSKADDFKYRTANSNVYVYYSSTPKYNGDDRLVYSICNNYGKCAESEVLIKVKGLTDKTTRMMEMSSTDSDKNRLMIKDLEAYPKNSLMVFDKRGSLVYQAAPYKNDFYGKPNVGTMHLGATGVLPEGTYYYIVDYGSTEKEMLKGFVYITE